MKKSTKIIIFLSLIILVNVIIAFFPHFIYPYPTLADEYTHISLVNAMINEGNLPFTNPYFSYDSKHLNLESGFHFLLTLFFKILPGNPILFYKYFIILFMIINSLLLFYLVMLWFKNYYIALISVLFFGTIKSTGDFLAHTVFIPLTLGITLLLLSFIFFHKLTIKPNKKQFIYLLITLIITAISYPPALFFFLLTVLFYILSMDHDLNKIFNVSRKKFFQYFSLLSIILILAFILVLKFLNLLNNIIFTSLWTSIQTDISPLFFFGIVPSIFALIGIFFLTTSKKPKILLYWFLFSIIEMYLFIVAGFTIFVPFRRLALFYFIGISVLAGIGVVNLITYSKKFIKMKNIKLIMIILIAGLIGFQYYFFITTIEISTQIMDERTYNALDFINKQYPNKEFVLTDTLTSIAVYPITGDNVEGLIHSNIGGGNPDTFREFENTNCNEKKNILENLEISEETTKILILIKVEQNCNFLDLKYDKNIFVYEYSTN